MKRLALCLTVIAMMVLTASSVALAQEKPEFRFGFKALAEQIPEVVGEPLENEHWGANGDSLQRTTTGLMAWRKADNWTAFTNGSRTWINGPEGVAERANDDRFAWEAPAPPPAPAEPSTPPQLAAQPIAAPTAAPAPPPPAPTSGALTWNIDRPKNGEKAFTETMVITGWVVDPKGESLSWTGIDEFHLYLDGARESGARRLDVTSVDRTARQDVAGALGKPAYANSGFSISTRLTGVSQGDHTLYLYAHSSVSGWDYKTIAVTLRPSLASLNVQDSDLPGGYRVTDSASGTNSHYRVYETGLVSNGPAFVYSELLVASDAAAARSAVERYGAGDPTAVPITVLSSSASRGFEAAAPTVAGRPWAGVKMVVFSVENVIGVVFVGGNANYSLVSQSAAIADRIACRIAGAPVPAGPAFQLIGR